MSCPNAECPKSIRADLPRLLAELKELSARTKPRGGLQRDRSQGTRLPCIVIRGK